MSLTAEDTASACYRANWEWKGEKHVCGACGKSMCESQIAVYPPGTPNDEIYGDIHLTPYQGQLIRAVYIAEVLSPYGDSCKLRLDPHGNLQYLVPRYDEKDYIGRTPDPLPKCIQENKREFEKLLASRPNTYEWDIGSVFGTIYAESTYRWCECPECGRLGITDDGRPYQLPCYHTSHDYEFLETIRYDDERNARTDATPRLIKAYTAARQARFEHRS